MDLSGVRVCMATSAHPAHDDRIFFKEARSLVKAGAEVVVLCGRDEELPDKTYGVQFVQYDGGGSLKQRLRTLSRLERAIAQQRCDVVHCHEPDSLIAAMRVKRRTGARVIFDSHELWGGKFAGRLPKRLWKPAEKAYQVAENYFLCRCDAAIGATRAISEYLSKVLGRDRVATILNVPVVEVFGESEEKDWNGKTYLCHEGHLPFNRGLKNMAEVVRRLSNRYDVVMKIVGDVFRTERDWLEAFISKYGLEKSIIKTGWLNYEEVGKAIAPCHIGMISLLPSPNNMIAAPNKCFNYLLYGLPIVGPEYPASHFAILEREGCAVLADPTDADSYEEAVVSLLQDREVLMRMADKALALSKEKYRWEHMEPVLFSLYNQVLRRRACQ